MLRFQKNGKHQICTSFFLPLVSEYYLYVPLMQGDMHVYYFIQNMYPAIFSFSIFFS